MAMGTYLSPMIPLANSPEAVLKLRGALPVGAVPPEDIQEARAGVIDIQQINTSSDPSPPLSSAAGFNFAATAGSSLAE